MADLIDRAALLEKLGLLARHEDVFRQTVINGVIYTISKKRAVDAVEVDALEAWLYEIAFNNVDNYLCDACEEIISRLDGLRVFARERRTDAPD